MSHLSTIHTHRFAGEPCISAEHATGTWLPYMAIFIFYYANKCLCTRKQLIMCGIYQHPLHTAVHKQV